MISVLGDSQMLLVLKSILRRSTGANLRTQRMQNKQVPTRRTRQELETPGIQPRMSGDWLLLCFVLYCVVSCCVGIRRLCNLCEEAEGTTVLECWSEHVIIDNCTEEEIDECACSGQLSYRGPGLLKVLLWGVGTLVGARCEWAPPWGGRGFVPPLWSIGPRYLTSQPLGKWFGLVQLAREVVVSTFKKTIDILFYNSG